jgi:signal transduction histidine kinase
VKLRQKSYVLTVALVAAVLFVSTFVLVLQNLRATFGAIESRAIGEEKALALSVDGMLAQTPEQNRAAYVRGFALYDSNGATFALGRGEKTWVSIEPVPPEVEPGRVHRITQNGRTVLAMADTLSDGVWLRFGLDVTDELDRTVRQAIGSVLVCTLLTAGIAAALYVMLERVNQPVERLAHELRTPLTVIRGYGELLERTKLSPEQQHQAVSYIVSESERLSDISQKLLTLADTRRNVFRPERLSLAELAAHLQKTYPTLETDIRWEWLTADRTLLLSLLGNLIGNAVKASAPGAPVRMTAFPGTIVITDMGSGMTEEQLRYVNDPAHARNPSIRSGLGVPLCHEIAALHNAVLSYSSKAGEGTTATVSFTTL